MNKSFGIALGVAAAIVAVIVLLMWKSDGKIGGVRVQRVEDDVSFVVFDFTIKNDSGTDVVVSRITGSVETPTGIVEGNAVAARDLLTAFRAYPALGEQSSEPLKERDVLPAHRSIDRMVGIRFDLPEDAILKGKTALKIEDATGAYTRLTK